MGMGWTTCAGLALLWIGPACSGAGRKDALEDVAPSKPAVVDPQATGGGEGTCWVTAVDPKPLSRTVERGLAWLLETQHQDGGWSQGEESQHMGAAGEVRDRSNVADTCISLLALLRASPKVSSGPYAGSLRRGAAFVCGKVEASDEQSLSVTDVTGTRVQMKIGNYVDTFLASMVLSELKGRSGDEDLDARVASALDKVVRKIERNQQQNGGFEGQGWAPVLSQAMAGKALNRAAQLGLNVSKEALSSSLRYFEGLGDASDAAAPGSAGVALYSSSAGLAGLQEFVNTSFVREGELKQILSESKDEQEKADARDELARIDQGRKAQGEAQGAMIGRLDDPSFVSGFGSNGGEEFLSYMNIAESLVVRADDAWRRYDASMTQNLERIQNQDGSWSGHHCITGRNFCTATALLVLMADRTPVPEELLAAAR